MIDCVETKKLKVIKDFRGHLMEMLRCDDNIFEKFGQVYLSVCLPGVVKGWHYHKIQTDFFTIVKGNAKVVLHDMGEDSPTKGKTQEFFIGEDNPTLIKIPPYVAHGMTPADDKPIYLINCPTEPYNYDTPDEHRIPFNSKEIDYNWGVEKGE